MPVLINRLKKNTLYTLNGSASSDPDGDALTYLWTAPNGVILSSTTVAKPTFITPSVTITTSFTFTLIVSDGKLNSLSDQVVITVKQANQAPAANAGADQSVNEGTLVILDASASTDPDNDALVYAWSAPSGIALSSISATRPTFIAPEVSTEQNYTFSLIVNDGTVSSTADQVIVTVKQVNKAPTLTSTKLYNATEDIPQEFLIEGSDTENDPISFSIENLPSFLHLTKKQTLQLFYLVLSQINTLVATFSN